MNIFTPYTLADANKVNENFEGLADGSEIDSGAITGSKITVSGCMARKSGDSTIPNGTWTLIDLEAELYDTDDWHSNTTEPSKITVDADGFYILSWGIAFAGNTTGIRFGTLNISGSSSTPYATTIYAEATSNYSTIVGNSSVAYLSSGDYVQLKAYQNSGGNLTVFGGNTYNSTTYLSVVKLGV